MDLIGFFRNFALQMCNMETYKIDLLALEGDVTTYNFHLSDAFFEEIQAPEIKHGNLDVDLRVKKVSNMFEIDFHTQGVVSIPCDICLEDMEQPIDTKDSLVVRLGVVNEEDEDDEIVTVDREQGIFDASWYIYEFIILSIPIKHVHEEGQCNPEMLKMFHDHQVSDQDGQAKPIDSRWQELLKIKDKD